MSSQTVDSRTIQQVQYATPTTGQTVTMIDNGNVSLIINPAGTLLTLTVTLPPNPVDGDIITIASSQLLTALTITGTIIGTLTTMLLGGFASFMYSGTASKWFRTG